MVQKRSCHGYGRSFIYNLIEPPSLVRDFMAHPPLGFAALELQGSIPAFTANLDVLSTMEPGVRRRIEGLPFAHWWRRWLRLRTCFVGTTVTEYALLPQGCAPEHLIDNLLRDAAQYPLIIIKDLPVEAALVGEPAYAYSTAVARAASAAGFLLLEGQALAYVPIDFESIEQYLARMPRLRRKEFRRKWKSSERVEIEEIPTGDARLRDATLLEQCYALYRNVYAQSTIQFDLLSSEFFSAVLHDGANRGVLFAYRVHGELIGINLCFMHEGRLIDKDLGLAYPQAREHDLYFVSWFHNLSHALTHGLRCYVAGWTDPEVKRRLGARFTFTRHAVYIRNPLLRQALRPFKRSFEADSHWYAAADHP